MVASPGAHELEQMQLILETVPVIREEDKDDLLKVMPSFVSSTWEVKRPLRKLLPEVNSEGTAARLPGCFRGGAQRRGFTLRPESRQSPPRGPVSLDTEAGEPLAAGLCPLCFQTEFGHQTTLKAVHCWSSILHPDLASFSSLLTCLPPSPPPPFTLFPLEGMVRFHQLQSLTQAQLPVPPVTSCLALGKFLNFSASQFP